jgi:hypothetical protein
MKINHSRCWAKWCQAAVQEEDHKAGLYLGGVIYGFFEHIEKGILDIEEYK